MEQRVHRARAASHAWRHWLRIGAPLVLAVAAGCSALPAKPQRSAAPGAPEPDGSRAGSPPTAPGRSEDPIQKAPPEERAKLFVQALKESKTPADEDRLRALLRDGAVAATVAVLAEVEAHLAALKAPRQKSDWQAVRAQVLCDNAAKLPADWLVPRLVEVLQDPENQRQDALRMLFALNQADSLAAAFPKLSPDLRRAAVQALGAQWSRKKSLEGTKQLAASAFKDPDPQVGEAAFRQCCEAAFEKPDIRAFLSTALHEEKDLARRKRLDRIFVDGLTRNAQLFKTDDHFQLATAGPSQGVVSHAVGQLTWGPEQRVAHTLALVERYAAITSPENRAWLLLELRHLEERKLPEVRKLYQQALNDPDTDVRAAAIAGTLCNIAEIGQESGQVLRLILTETDMPKQQRLMRAYDLWAIKPLSITAASKAARERRDATSQLLALATFGDEEVAATAVKALPVFFGEDKIPTPMLQMILRRTKTPEARVRLIELLFNLDVNTVLPLCKQALAEESEAVRTCAFNLLYQKHARQNETVRTVLEEAAANEAVPAAKSAMEARLKKLPPR